MSAARLPKGLPDFPPVPEGFDAWEAMRRGYVGENELIAYTPRKRTAGFTRVWHLGTHAMGLKDLVYIRAIKRPAKLKKPKQAQAVKARLATIREPGREGVKHFVLPADAASVERMEDQGIKAINALPYSATIREIARAVLAANGITSAKGRA